MKNRLFIKAGTIAILLFSVVLFINGTNNESLLSQANAAGNSGSKVQLKINEGAVTCTGWLGTLNMGALSSQFGSNIMSGTYSGNSWSCTDTKGTGTRAFTIRITGDLYGGYGNAVIASGNASICMTGAALALIQGVVGPVTTTLPASCASTGSLVTTQDLIRRNAGDGPIFQYSLTPKILVSIPQNQAPGTYTGVLEVSIP